MHTYALFSALYLPHIGGVETFTKNMAYALAKRGNKVHIVTLRIDDSPTYEQPHEHISIWRLPCWVFMQGRLPWTHRSSDYKRIMNEIGQYKPDRVLVNTRFYPHSLEGLRFAKHLGAAAVVLDHGSAHIVLDNTIKNRVLARYEHAITRKVKAFNPVFCGISEKSAQWLAHFDINTSLVIPNAIDAHAFRSLSTDQSFRQMLGIPDDALLVTYSGRLTVEKGASSLVKAASQLANNRLHVVLAGKGPLHAQLSECAAPTVHFVGNLDPSSLSTLLQESNAFCLPSRSEGFCTALLEASACGIPAAITDVGGARELIPNETCGIILADGKTKTVYSALQEFLARGKQGLHTMGKQAQHHVERHYTWNKSVDALENAFAAAYHS